MLELSWSSADTQCPWLTSPVVGNRPSMILLSKPSLGMTNCDVWWPEANLNVAKIAWCATKEILIFPAVTSDNVILFKLPKPDIYVLKRGRQGNHCPNACKIKIGNDRKKQNIGKRHLAKSGVASLASLASVECGSMLRWVLLAPQVIIVIPSVSKKARLQIKNGSPSWNGSPRMLGQVLVGAIKNNNLPSGERLHSNGTSPCFYGKIHYFDWAIFHCHVSSPEGISH